MYRMGQMELRVLNTDAFLMHLEMSEHSLQGGAIIDGVSLGASQAVTTTGHVDVWVSSANTSAAYYVIASYSLRDTSIVKRPIDWMHAGRSTSFSFIPFLVSMLQLRPHNTSFLNYQCLCNLIFYLSNDAQVEATTRNKQQSSSACRIRKVVPRVKFFEFQILNNS